MGRSKGLQLKNSTFNLARIRLNIKWTNDRWHAPFCPTQHSTCWSSLPPPNTIVPCPGRRSKANSTHLRPEHILHLWNSQARSFIQFHTNRWTLLSWTNDDRCFHVNYNFIELNGQLYRYPCQNVCHRNRPALPQRSDGHSWDIIIYPRSSPPQSIIGHQIQVTTGWGPAFLPLGPYL